MGKSRKFDAEQTEITKLKHKILEQEKEIAKLKRNMKRVEEIDTNDYAETKKSMYTQPRCPKCSTVVSVTPVGGFTLKICPECKWRVREK